jgi:hypothetical protein
MRDCSDAPSTAERARGVLTATTLAVMKVPAS